MEAIQKQVKLPLKVALDVALQGIRIRFGRSVVTVLGDEPTGNLDTKTGTEIVDLLKELNQQEGVTVICSTHDPKMLASSERVCWMIDGRLEKITGSDELNLEEMEGDRAQQEI